MFTEDVVRPLYGQRNLSDRQQLLIARLFIIAIVALTYALSLFEPRRVFTLGVWCFSGFSSLFPLIVAALYWPRLTKQGAYACILAAAGSGCGSSVLRILRLSQISRLTFPFQQQLTLMATGN